jgi:iron(III) transport system substrate-binding protein
LAVAVAALALILGSACATPAPGGAPTGAGTNASGAQPAAAAAGASAAAARDAEWQAVVEAAKREGTVALMGPTGNDNRDALVVPFQEQYGITVEYLSATAANLAPRLQSERAAEKYLWDVLVAGALEKIFVPMKVLDPLEPALLPETKDPQKWRGGDLEFLDAERTALVMSPFRRGTLFVNTSLVRPDEFTSYRDLLDPKWKGRIVIDDPRRAGPGQSTFAFFYMHPQLGPEFIRALVRQELTVLADVAQELDVVGQGRFPILVGGSDATAKQRIKLGVPLAIVDTTRLQEGSDVNPANGEVGLINRAPHPNAARVYLNWLLSKEGQTSWARGTGYVSSRLDVPTDLPDIEPWRVPQLNEIKTYGGDAPEIFETKVVPLVRELLP